MLYLDTSVLVSALTPEATTPRVQEWLAAQDAGQLAVSDWVLTEFGCALSAKMRLGTLRQTDRARAAAVLRTWVDETLTVHAIGRAAFSAAGRLCQTASPPLRAPDALHLAVAAELGAALITSDRAQARAGQEVGVQTRLLPGIPGA